MAHQFTLTAAERKLLPTDEDVAFYARHGWYVSQPLFTDEELAQASNSVERFYEGARDRTLPSKPGSAAYWEPSHGDVQRHHDYIAYENREIFRIFCKPLVGAVASRLMERPTVRLWNSTLIHKPARAEEPTNVVPWHTDLHHWQMCTSNDLLTAFIPLHSCDESHGTLTVLDGSHKWKDLPPEAGDDPSLHFAERPSDALNTAVRKTAAYNDAVMRRIPLVIEAGRVSFHHCRTFHASGPNRSGRPRRVVTIRFQEGDNRWRPALRPTGEPVVYSHDALVRNTAAGNPDYSDPEFCPVLWQEGP